MWSAVIALLRNYRLQLLAALVGVVVLAAGFGLVFRVAEGEPTRTLVALFPEAPGLYHDNAVDILGVQTGHVTSVTPGKDNVRVTMEIPRSTKLPANVRAILLAPNPVSDRTIELYPPYTSGPTLPDATTIPLARTAVPLGVDEIFSAVDEFARTLGPSGVNRNGSLSDVVSALAKLTKGNGRSLQNTLAGLASALPAFTADPGRLASLITSLDRISTTLARHNSTVDRFFSEVTRATGELASERDTLANAIVNLQDALQRVSGFVRANRDTINGSVTNLAAVSKAIVRDQQGLITTFGTAALGFQNFIRAVDLDAACQPGEARGSNGRCPIVYGRLNLTSDVASVIKTYCRGPFEEGAPIVLGSVPGVSKLGVKGVTDAGPINTLCFTQYSIVQGRPGTPGAPPSPDLGLRKWLR